MGFLRIMLLLDKPSSLGAFCSSQVTNVQAEGRKGAMPGTANLAYGGEKSASVTCFVLAEGTHQTEWLFGEF